MNVPTIQPHSL